jgi:hypothetical protein
MEKLYTDHIELAEGQRLSRNTAGAHTPLKNRTKEPAPIMSSAEHFDEAKRALADGYRVDSNPVKTVWGRIGDARMHLGAIEPGSSQYLPAQRLMREALSRERQMENVSVHVTNELMIRQREMMAGELEEYYVGRGILVEVELSGSDKTCIRLASAAFCETAIDRIANKTNFFSHLREAGFKKVILGDHEENAWAYSLRTL